MREVSQKRKRIGLALAAVILPAFFVLTIWTVKREKPAPPPPPGFATAPLAAYSPYPIQQPEDSTILAYDYTVLNVKDISLWTIEKESKPWRKRFDVSIMAPAAKTFEARGQTVVRACKVLRSEYGAHVVRVWVEPNDNTRGLGFVLAMATYSPDGKGMSGEENEVVWDNVRATDYQVSARALKMTKDSRLGDISMEQARIIDSRRSYTPH